ncbi:hypothetical protein IHO40_02640 [Wolbachia endosymbiont of Mansonella ozzardi]|nr:hypothetical protein [Wolbachia endosymbiont of Mansonella ozzardi]
MIRMGGLPDDVLGGNIGGNPTANSGSSGVHEEQPNLGKNNENMGRDTGNQPRYIIEVHLVPRTGTPPTYKTTLYVKIVDNSQIKKNSYEDNIKELSENPEFIECTLGLEVVFEGDRIDSHAG